MIRSENGLHLAKFFLAFFDGVRLGVLRHQIILGVNEFENLSIKIQMDNTTFIVYRAGCSILDRLSHIVYINVIAEHFSCAAISGGYWRTGKANKRGMWQIITNDFG